MVYLIAMNLQEWVLDEIAKASGNESTGLGSSLAIGPCKYILVISA
jgi:hypothetical protein